MVRGGRTLSRWLLSPIENATAWHFVSGDDSGATELLHISRQQPKIGDRSVGWQPHVSVDFSCAAEFPRPKALRDRRHPAPRARSEFADA